MAQPPRTPIDPGIQNFLTRLRNLQEAGKQPGGIAGLMQPDMGAVRAREEQLRGYLGATDYGKRLEEAQNMARLQAGLALAQRGFAAAGAAPRRGESPFATVSRELLSPVAGDVGAVATNLMQQRAALDAAKAAEDRQLKATALQQVMSDDAAFRDLAAKLATEKTSKLQVFDTGLFRQKLGDNKFDTPVETKAVVNNGVLSQVRVDTGKPISVGTGIGQYSFYEKPTGTAATPKGVEDPKFKDSFRGMLGQMGNVQELQGLGKTAIRFDAAKFTANPELESGANFPFERVTGVDQASGSVVTAPLTEEQQKTYADNLRAGYLNIFDAIKTGEEPANLNNTFIARELSKSFGALGLPDAAQLPAGVVRGKEQITSPTAITSAYKNAVPGFSTDVQGTLDGLPLPRSNENLRSGTGRLVLFNELGVPFGQDTVSPPPIPADSDAVAVGQRAASIRALDAGGIQDRILAEKASKGTSMGSKLRTSTADSRAKQLTIVSEALEKEKEKLTKAMSSSDAAENVEILDKTLEMLAQLQKIDFDMKQSGVPGFITGNLEAGLRKFLGLSIRGYFTGPEGEQAANSFIASMPIVQELFARDILREVGEQRYTKADLEGAQRVLISINNSDDFNADRLRKLTGYLKNIVKSGLNAAGTMDIPPATLEKAAMLGIDLKSITPKNNYYSPYFKQGKYAVTNQPIPEYSQQYMNGLRDNGIFGYAAVRGTTGPRAGKVTAYKLIQIDQGGNPIPKDQNDLKKGFQTVVVPVQDGVDWKTTIPKKLLDYNRNFLLKTYQLDR